MPGSAMIAREATFHELPTSDLQQHPQVRCLLNSYLTAMHAGSAAQAVTCLMKVCDVVKPPCRGVVAQVDVTLQDVDQVDSEQLAAIVGVQSKPQQPQLSRLQTLAAASQQLIALVDGPDKVQRLATVLV